MARKNPAAVKLGKLRMKSLSKDEIAQLGSKGGATTAARRTPPERTEAATKAGIVGGKARAKALSPEERKEIARKAAKARWGSKK